MISVLSAATLIGVAAPANAAVVPARVVVQQGEMPLGATAAVSQLRAPFANTLGHVGFVGEMADGNVFVWLDTGIAWRNSDAAGVTLTGADVFMGLSDTGNFIYGPSVDGGDAVWADNVPLTIEGNQAPLFPMGTTVVFSDRPTMLPGGGVYWVSGFRDMPGVGDDGTVLYRSPTATPGGTQVVLRSDVMVGGFDLARPDGVDRDFSISDDEAHHLHVLLLDTGNPDDDRFLYLDGTLILREGDPTAGGDAWSEMILVDVNNDGHHLLSGVSDGAAATDELLAYDGSVALREGDTAGVTVLDAPAFVQGLSINDLGEAVHVWRHGASETVFHSCDAAALDTSSTVVLTVGDSLDFDGDGAGDADVTDLNTLRNNGGGADLQETGDLYLEVDLDYGMGPLEAVVHINVNCCGNGVIETPEECDDQNADDTDDCLATCVAASCGDGFVQAGVEQCDDGNDIDTDACPTNCEDARCGDGFVQDGVEACDDGNDVDGDGCDGCQPTPGGSTGDSGGGATTTDATTAATTTTTTDPTGADAGTDDAGASGGGGSDDGCGCRHHEATESWALMLMVMLWRRRRRG